MIGFAARFDAREWGQGEHEVSRSASSFSLVFTECIPNAWFELAKITRRTFLRPIEIPSRG